MDPRVAVEEKADSKIPWRTMKASKRLATVSDNVWAWVSELSRTSSIQPVVNLGHGSIEYNPPRYLIDAHKQALDQVDYNQYGPTDGLFRLKQALATTYSEYHAKQIDPQQEICITTGATAAILSAMVAFVEPGDEVIVMEPAFNLYPLHIEFVAGIIKQVPIHPPVKASSTVVSADEWTVQLDELEKAFSPRTKMLIINSPHNPLGKVFSREELYAIGNLCVAHGVLILSDEVYERQHFGICFPRIATLSPALADNTLSVGSVGKTFNATGWRVGYIIGPKHLIQHVHHAHIILAYTTAGPAQYAAAVGFEEAEKHEYWDETKKTTERKVQSMCDFMLDLGLPHVRPSGAYFVYINTRQISIPSTFSFPSEVQGRPRDYKLCYFLIHKFGISTIPGSAFYSWHPIDGAEDYLRLSLCKSDEQIELAKERLKGLRAYIMT